MDERRKFLIPEGEGDTRMTQMEIESQKPSKKRAGRKALVVAAGLMAASAAQAQAKDRSWLPSGRDVLETVSDVHRTERRHKEIMTRDRQINAERQAQIEARKQEQLAREKTRRQEEALRNAERAGWTGVNVKSTEDETTLNVTAQGTTPAERMQGAQQVHEATMKDLELQQQLQAQLQAAIEARDTAKVSELTQRLVNMAAAKKRAAEAAKRLSGIPGAVQERSPNE